MVRSCCGLATLDSTGTLLSFCWGSLSHRPPDRPTARSTVDRPTAGRVDRPTIAVENPETETDHQPPWPPSRHLHKKQQEQVEDTEDTADPSSMSTPPLPRPCRISGRQFSVFIIVLLSWLGQLLDVAEGSLGSPPSCFAHPAPKQHISDANTRNTQKTSTLIRRRRAIATAGAAFVGSQAPIAVIAADGQAAAKDSDDPLAAFGASLSGSGNIMSGNGAPSSQQPAGAGATTVPTSAAGGPPPPAAAGTPPSSLDATLDQLSKKRTIEPRTHG